MKFSRVIFLCLGLFSMVFIGCTNAGSTPSGNGDTDWDTFTDTGTYSNTDTDTGTESVTKSDSESNTDADSESNTDADSESDLDTNTGTDTDSESNTDADSESNTDADSESNTDADSESDMDTDTGTDSGVNLDTATDTAEDTEAPVDTDGSVKPVPTLTWDGLKYSNVVYKTVDDQELMLDIFLPDSSGQGPTPVVIYTHGGGWAAGSKDNIGYGVKKQVALGLLNAGVAVVSVTYRLTNNTDILMQHCVIDAKDAGRFITKFADSYNIDPSKTAYFGDSAGAHIAMMAALAGNDDESFMGAEELRKYSNFINRGVVSWYGPVSFMTKDAAFWQDRNPAGFDARVFGTETDSALQDVMREMVSPIHYYTTNSPPLYMVHGDGDTTIPYGHVEGMRDYADSLGIKNFSYLKVVGAGHNFREAVEGTPINPTTTVIVEKTIQKLLGFF